MSADPASVSKASPPSVWLPEHVATIGEFDQAPVIRADDFAPVSPDIDIWDAWPIQDANGHTARMDNGATLWMALGAPRFPDPEERHGHARIHLILRTSDGWLHLGPAMPDGFSPGSREWSGSAVLADDHRLLTLYFTAAGRRAEADQTFEQRIFVASADLIATGDSYRLQDWRDLREIVVRDPAHYMASDSGVGSVGTIKAFRDPGYFRDPADGRHHLFFAGSLAGSNSTYNGVIGAAIAEPDAPESWHIVPPIVRADGLNNELERPHVVHHAGRYYLFWSTQRHVFDPTGPTGPTGLYGMVADHLGGPWHPLNGHGLVFANPVSAPRQAYSWWVMPDLQVTSFVDDWIEEDASVVRRFGGTFAPMLRLRLDGARATLAK